MPSVDDASLNHNRHIATWLKLVSIQEGLLLQKLDYHSVRRMVSPSQSVLRIRKAIKTRQRIPHKQNPLLESSLPHRGQAVGRVSSA